MERRRKLAALQMTQGHRSGKHYKETRLPTHLSHGKKNRRWYHLEGNDTRGPRRAREPHHNNPETTPRTWRAEGELFTYASEDEHGRHYRSCATEWGWREDENRPPYKRPKAIIRANAKTQLDYQPTFHMERETVAGIIWRGTSSICWYHLEGHGGTKPSQGATPQQPIHNSKDMESRRGIVHICLLGRGWPTLPLMRYRVGMERR